VVGVVGGGSLVVPVLLQDGAPAGSGVAVVAKSASGAVSAVKKGGKAMTVVGVVGGGSLVVPVLLQDGAPSGSGVAVEAKSASGAASTVKRGGKATTGVGSVGGGSLVVPVLLQDGAPAGSGVAVVAKSASGAASVVKTGGKAATVVGAVGGSSLVVPVLLQDGAPAGSGVAVLAKSASGAASAVEAGRKASMAIGAVGGGSSVAPVLLQDGAPSGSGAASALVSAAAGAAGVDPGGAPVLLQDRASVTASAAVARAVDQVAHLRLLAEARGAAAWAESALIDRAVARADAERAVLAAAKLERTVIYAVARAEFESAGAGSLGEAAFELAVRNVAASRIPDGIRAAGSPMSVRALSARIRSAPSPAAGGSSSALASQVSSGAIDGGVAFCGAVVLDGDFDAGVPDGGNLTGGRARHRGALLRAAGLPVPVPLFSQEEREARVARRAVVVRERRAKRSDMVGLRALLHHLGSESQTVLAEVHGDEWRPHRWAHWIFPCSALVAEEPVSFLTLRTADAFVESDSFAWREVVERIVGKAESTAGGLHAFFVPFMLARIDCFVSTLSQVRRRPVWLVRLLQRLRRLRALMPGDLAVGPLSRPVSRPSKRGRAGMRRALLLSMADLRSGGVPVAADALGGAVPGVVREDGVGSVGSRALARAMSPVSPAPPVPVAAAVLAASAAGPAAGARVSGVPTRVPKQAPYLKRRSGNAVIEKLLARGAALVLPKLLRGGV